MYFLLYLPKPTETSKISDIKLPYSQYIWIMQKEINTKYSMLAITHRFKSIFFILPSEVHL